MAATTVHPDLVRRLAETRHLVVLTGAGISAESGVPTFRDARAGLWSKYRPEELATVAAFEADPETVWAWYEWRRDLVGRATPNSGHLALARLEALVPRFTLVTQNVDGLHRRAGSRDPIEFHGSLFDNRCLACGESHDLPRPCPAPRHCPGCGGWIRPGVVWFGEAIPPFALERSFAAAGDCDLFMSVGTSAEVYPAAGLAGMARRGGATLVEINPNATALSRHADHVLPLPAGEALPAICRLLEERRA